MKTMLPALDIPADFMPGKDLEYGLLRYYTRFPCKIRSAIFFMCTGGTFRATVNFSEYTLSKGDFVFLVPDSFIQIHHLSPDFRFSFAAFSSGFLDKVNMTGTALEFIPAISRNPVLRLSDEQFSLFSDFFDMLIRCQQCNGVVRNTETHKAVLTLIMQQVAFLYPVHQPAGENGKGRDKEIYTQFILLLHQFYNREHRITFYAEKIGITVQHFCNIVKKNSGKRATEIVDKFLLMEAKTRLRFTDMPVKNIAFELGFSNGNFFYKWFKTRTAQTPVEYRNGLDVPSESDRMFGL
ncbi:MAG: helix-turn-helix domain-containing protein [Alistipes sp.]|nr:helix-turn-helix domain-containing protein [Alistipes sp.]